MTRTLTNSLILTFLFVIIADFSFGQAPEGINYQAVIRNSSGDLYSDQSILCQVDIINALGATVYSEKHAVTTNGQGIANYVIGDGNVLSGDFSSIDWGSGPYFLKLYVSFGGTF